MLSAVAARKAAQAAKNPPSTPTTAPEVAPPTPSRPPLPPSSSSTKRKPSSQRPEAPLKKKKKKTERPRKNATRYFQEPNPEPIFGQEDVITIDSDVSEPDSEEDLADIDFSIAGFPTAAPPVKRAWSPSVPVAAPVLDSSDEEEDDAETEQAPLPTPLQLDVLSTFRPIHDQNVFFLKPDDLVSIGYSEDLPSSTLISLQPGETLAFVGTYQFSVLQGSVTILGTTFRPSRQRHDVFAPRSSPIPIITAAASSESSSPLPLPSRIKAPIQPSAAVIVLHELRTNIRGLERVCGVFEGVFRPRRHHYNSFDFGLSGLYMVTEPVKNVEPFQLSPSWRAALSSVTEERQEEEVYIVQGAKKSGKSTFARTLVNQLLSRYQRVAYLECDLGQSEFTPGGMVALNIIETPLLGPPFTHPSLPITAHYIGGTSPKSSPSHYLAAIQACAQTYRLDLKRPIDDGIEGSDEDARITDSIPLIVNTMGWTKGLGADLLLKIQEIVQPTRIFEVEAPKFDDWAQPAPAPPLETGVRVSSLQPIPQPATALYPASDLRTLALLSYLHAVFSRCPDPDAYRQITASTWNTSLPLCAQTPYAVDLLTAIEQIVLTGAGAEDVVAEEVAGVLNVSLVGLVACEPGMVDAGPLVPGTGIFYAQGGETPSPMSSTCLGLALVRSVAPQADVLHLLTPTPPGLLGRARVLVKGEMELPVWGMLDFREEDGAGVAGVERSKVPYLQWDKARGLGAEKRKVRRNLMRKAQA